jgi:hypothetical protein
VSSIVSPHDWRSGSGVTFEEPDGGGRVLTRTKMIESSPKKAISIHFFS